MTMTSPRYRPAETINTSLSQDVWWTDGQGITRLIEDLSDRHRANIARFLVDHAAHRHYRTRRYWYEWGQFIGGYGGMPDDVMDEVLGLISRPGWVASQIRKEQDRGQHLDWIRSTPLFLRMVRGIEDKLAPGVIAPGTVNTAHEGQDGRRQ